MLRLLLAGLVVLLAVSAVASEAIDKDYKWAYMANFTKQWTIGIKLTKGADKSVFVPQTGCNFSVPFVNSPCLQPKMSADRGDKIQVTLTRKNVSQTLKTYADLTPLKVFANLCFSPNSTVDRPWRKFKPQIYRDKSCDHAIGHTTFQANQTSYVLTAEFSDTMPSATFFVRAAVKCDDGTKDGKWCQYDNTRGDFTAAVFTGNYIETERIPSITPGMRVAVGIASAIGPAFLAGFFIVDYYNRRKAGK